MQIQVYQIEKHTRSTRRKIRITVILLFAIVMTLFGGNFVGPVSGVYLTRSGVGAALFIICLAGLYWYMQHEALSETVLLSLEDA
ncbi:MAG: hypothetical protein H6765_02405 [Candidatus Peribacteria bacterium]|nr:MAG: hypothetical protein H6765_02405 [Candidatus Peribacteria bacterium]